MNKRGFFYVSQKKRIAYLEIPKNGCTSFKNFLLSIEDRELGKAIEKGNVNPRIVHEKEGQQILKRVYKADLDISNLFSFTFVRNPYLRLLSFYNSKVLNFWDQGIEKSLKKIGIKKGMEFKDCVKAIVNTDYNFLDNHIAPQSDFLFHEEKLVVDLIGKIEDTIIPFKLLSALTYMKQNIPSYYVLQSSELFHLLDNSEILDMIYEYYKQDFNLLNYDKALHYNDNKHIKFSEIYLNNNKYMVIKKLNKPFLSSVF